MQNFKICGNNLSPLCYVRKFWSNLYWGVERELLAIIIIDSQSVPHQETTAEILSYAWF